MAGQPIFLQGYAFDEKQGITMRRAIMKYPLIIEFIESLRILNLRSRIPSSEPDALSAEDLHEMESTRIILASDIINLLRQGKLVARGFKDGAHETVELAPLWWTEVLINLDEDWAEAYGLRVVGIRLFETTLGIDLSERQKETKQTPAHPRGYAAKDALLAPEMARLIKSGKANGPMAAAYLIVDRIAGSGTLESKAKRLAARYSALTSTGQF